MDQNDPYAPYGAASRPVRPLSPKAKKLIQNALSIAATGLVIVGGVAIAVAATKKSKSRR